MKVYWCPNTRAVRALWMLEELGQPYERVLVDIRNAEARNDPALRAVSPMGKVPALEDGATRLWDSGAICAYLADQYSEAGLAPAMAEHFSKAQVSAVAHGWGSFELMLQVLRAGLGRGPWILGARFCAADVLLGMSCHFMRQFGALQDEPVLFAYADRCAARPALQRALALEVLS